MNTETVEMIKGWVGDKVTGEAANKAAAFLARTVRCPIGEARAIVFRALTGRLPLATRMTKGELIMSVAWYVAGQEREKLAAEYNDVTNLCARIVCDVRGVIDAGLAVRREKLRERVIAAGLLTEDQADTGALCKVAGR